MSIETCPECGAEIAGGRTACAGLYEQLTYEALENLRIASVLMLAFDTYCMQHIETYCVSAKSYAAHLTRLCAGLEYDGKQEVYDALQRWYHSDLSKPEVLSERGTIYITDVQALDDPEAKREKIREWALNVWEAYSDQQDIARQWVEEALNWRGEKGRH